MDQEDHDRLIRLEEQTLALRGGFETLRETVAQAVTRLENNFVDLNARVGKLRGIDEGESRGFRFWGLILGALAGGGTGTLTNLIR